jgi:hypothetical protein
LGSKSLSGVSWRTASAILISLIKDYNDIKYLKSPVLALSGKFRFILSNILESITATDFQATEAY